MKVHEKSVVKFEYILQVNGEILERTSEDKTKTILIGHEKGLPPKLEESLLGREAGESFTSSVEDGYGFIDPAKIQIAPKSAFPKTIKLEVGEQLYSQDEDGNPVSLRITRVEGDAITVDANHEYAGKTLTYEIKIHSVRDAEQGELEHGHIHGEGGVRH
jgi:FKBP-type peptidyl-prolyl cis-trans isomerase SlyD